MKRTFTMEEVERVYDEIYRRLDNEIRMGLIETETEINEYKNAMLQGVYGTLMILAENWVGVRTMLDRIECDE